MSPPPCTRLCLKLLLFGQAGLLLAGVSAGLVFQHSARRLIEGELRARAGLLARQLAGEAARGVETRDVFLGLKPLLERVVGGPGVVYAEVRDARGRTLARAGARGARDLVEAESPVLSGRELIEEAGPPAGTREIGRALVGLSPEPTQRRLRRAARLAWGLVGLVMLLGGGVTAHLARRLSRPVGRLAEAAARLGSGERGLLVPVDTGDELGELARAFNRMSLDLERTTVSKRRLDDVIRHMPDALLVTDAQGRVVASNPAARALLGRAPEDPPGFAAQELLAQDGDGALDWKELQRLGAGRELLLRRDGGQRLPVLASSGVVRDAQGLPEGLVLIVRDLTERKALEARALQSEKVSALGRLVGGIAHELNNPLSVVLGFAQGLAQELPDGDPRELAVRSIEREARRCRGLVRDMLVFVRRDRFESCDFRLAAAVEDALRLAERQAREAGVRVERALSGDATVVGDRLRLQQVVMHLCQNAVEAMPEGGVLRVRLRTEAGPEGGWVVLEVEDTGAGMSDSVRARAFEPFFTTKEPGRGTGLGLAIIHEVVAQHGGSIELLAGEQRGTTARVRLPARDAPGAP